MTQNNGIVQEKARLPHVLHFTNKNTSLYTREGGHW